MLYVVYICQDLTIWLFINVILYNKYIIVWSLFAANGFMNAISRYMAVIFGECALAIICAELDKVKIFAGKDGYGIATETESEAIMNHDVI